MINLHTNYRSKSIVLLAVIGAAFAASFGIIGGTTTWKLFGIPVMDPNFADMRVITAGMESIRDGHDPLHNNPRDPWNRRLNYPGIWHSLHHFGIDQRHTAALGIGVIMAYLLGLWLLFHYSNHGSTLWILPAAFSPATVLGVERGNIDLLVFCLVAVMIHFRRQRVFALGIAGVAFLLKLFPVFGLALFFREDRKRFQWIVAVCGALVGCYVWFMHSEIGLIREATPSATRISYGIDVLWMLLKSQANQTATFVKFLSYGSIVGFGLLMTYRHLTATTQALGSDAPFIDSFRVGTSIYAGTFLLGNNFDYRLIFLLFCIPQLVSWISNSSRWNALLALSTIAAVYLSMWHLFCVAVIRKLRLGYLEMPAVYLDESLNWFVLFSLLCLFTQSLPAWTKMGRYNSLQSRSHPLRGPRDVQTPIDRDA